MRLVYSIILLGFLFACSNEGPFVGEIKQVDSLYNAVTIFENKLDSLNHEEVSRVFMESQKLESYLSDNYPDSLDRNFWINDMNRIYTVRRSLEKYLAKEGYLKQEIKYTKSQLLSLKKSLLDEKIDSVKAKDYLDTEWGAVENIKFLTHKLYPRSKEAIKKWPDVQKDLQQIADSIAAI